MPGFDLLNGEPGTSLFENAIFGKTKDTDLPTDLELPLNEYEADLTRYNAFAHENAIAGVKAIRLRDKLIRDQTVCRAWAVESAAYIPPEFKQRSINTFTITPSRTNYTYACEMATWAVVGLAVAGLAAIVALGWKLYNYVNNGSSGGDGGAGPSSSGVNKTSDAKEAKTVKALEVREARTEEYSKIYKELNDIMAKHSNPVKITAEAVGAELYARLKSTLKKETGVQLDMQIMGEILAAYYSDKQESIEFELFGGKPKNAAMYAFFTDHSVGDKIDAIVAAIRAEVEKVAATITAYIDQFKNLSEATAPNFGYAAQRNMNSVNDSIKNPNKQNKLKELAEELKKITALPPNPKKGVGGLDGLLKAVSDKNDKFTTLYRAMQETLYVGDKALVRKLGEIIVAMSEMEKSAKARLEEKRQAGTRPNTKEGAADSNIDTHAEWVNAAMRTMRSFMDEVKTTIQNTETFCTDIKKMDRGVANIVKELLRLADSIYSANGVKLTTFNDRANAIIDKLGGGGAKHTA